MNNNYTTVHPTTDGSMDTRYKFMQSDFMGKATAGHGTGKANDPLSAPFINTLPNVINVNDTQRTSFTADARRIAADAAASSSTVMHRHDRQFGPLHPMDYDPHPQVGHRQVDRPEPTPAFYERTRKLTPSESAKRNVAFRSDTQHMLRRDTVRAPAAFVPRPLMRDRRNNDLTQMEDRHRQAATMRDLGKTENPALRTDPFVGRHRKKQLSQTAAATTNKEEEFSATPAALLGDSAAAYEKNNLIKPRAVTRTTSNPHVSSRVSQEMRAINMAQVRATRNAGDHASAQERAVFDADGGATSNANTPSFLGEDYSMVPTGRTQTRGTSAGLGGDRGTSTYIPVRKPQMHTSRYKQTNPIDAQRVFDGDVSNATAWQFGTPVKAKRAIGKHELMRTAKDMRVTGQEIAPGAEAINPAWFNGAQTRGADFKGGKNANHEGVRAPGHMINRASQRASLGISDTGTRTLRFDTMVAPRGGELYENIALLTNPFATHHEAYYSLQRHVNGHARPHSAAPAYGALYRPINKQGGRMDNMPAGVAPVASAVATSGSGSAKTLATSL